MWRKEIFVSLCLSAALVLTCCSKSSTTSGQEIKLNQEIRGAQIAFKVVDIQRIPSDIISITKAGENNPTKINRFKLTSVIKNVSKDTISFNYASLVSLMSIGVITVPLAHESQLVELAPGQSYTIGSKINSSIENSLVFSLLIQNEHSIRMGPFRISSFE